MTEATCIRIQTIHSLARRSAEQMIADESNRESISLDGDPSSFEILTYLMATELDMRYQAKYKAGNGPVSNLGIHWAMELRYANALRAESNNI